LLESVESNFDFQKLAQESEEKLKASELALKSETGRLKAEIVERVDRALRKVEDTDDDDTRSKLEAAKQSYEEATEEQIDALRKMVSSLQLEKFEDEHLIRYFVAFLLACIIMSLKVFSLSSQSFER
jgi:lysyl-tRNA synthetase class I